MKNKVIIISLIFLVSVSEIYPSIQKLKEVEKEIKDKSTELRKVEEDIKQKKQARDEERKKEEIFRKEIKRIDTALSSLISRQREIRKKLKIAQRNIQIASKSLYIARDVVNSRETDFRKTINDAWTWRSSFRLISLENNDIDLKDVVEYKKRQYDLACKNEQMCQEALKRWQLAKNELTELETKLEENLKQQRDLKEEKKKLLTNATAHRIAIEEEIKSLNETATALNNMILKLERSKKLTEEQIEREAQLKKMVSQLKGNIPWPVQGEVVLKFGKNRRNDIEAPLISNGIRIKTSPRSCVRAVSKGECIFAGNFRSYGQMVVLDHGGAFYTIYGMLDKISVSEGGVVKAGDKVGVSGNDNDSTIYFEIRVDGQPVDPLQWLESK